MEEVETPQPDVGLWRTHEKPLWLSPETVGRGHRGGEDAGLSLEDVTLEFTVHTEILLRGKGRCS